MNFNTDGEKTPLIIDYKRVGYASLLIVDKSNKDSRDKFLLDNTYAKDFINSMPGRFGVIRIYIKKEERNKSYGTYFMRKIIEFFKGKVEVIHLIPYPIYEKKEHFDHMQTSFFIMKLVRFYKKFDFVVEDTRYIEPLKLTFNFKPMFLTLSNREIQFKNTNKLLQKCNLNKKEPVKVRNPKNRKERVDFLIKKIGFTVIGRSLASMTDREVKQLFEEVYSFYRNQEDSKTPE